MSSVFPTSTTAWRDRNPSSSCIFCRIGIRLSAPQLAYSVSIWLTAVVILMELRIQQCFKFLVLISMVMFSFQEVLHCRNELFAIDRFFKEAVDRKPY